jgi:hypothetical protein
MYTFLNAILRECSTLARQHGDHADVPPIAADQSHRVRGVSGLGERVDVAMGKLWSYLPTPVRDAWGDYLDHATKLQIVESMPFAGIDECAEPSDTPKAVVLRKVMAVPDFRGADPCLAQLGPAAPGDSEGEVRACGDRDGARSGSESGPRLAGGAG